MHDYLGMIFYFTAKGNVMVNMMEYIKNIVTIFPEEITTLKTSLVADHLFEVQEVLEAKALPEEQAMAFHHTATQLLVLSVRTRHSIQPETAFLMTRVKSPDEDDWGKVK